MLARSSKELLDIIRYPFYFKGDSDFERNPSKLLIHFDFSPRPKGTMFIAAPKDFVEKPSVKKFQRDDLYSYHSIFNESINREIELANEILRGVQGYANVTYATAPKQLPRDYDPFVCSLCDYGVIIHSMWGAEAEDATIKRYEQLRDAIIGKPKMLTV